MRGVDGEAECSIALVDGTLDAVLDKGVVAADIQLIQPQRVRSRLGDLLEARPGHRTQHVRDAELAGRPHHGRRTFRIEDFQRADRRDHHRHPHRAAELLDRGVDPGDVAQHPWPERDLVERHPVAAHRGLGLGGADDVIPGILVQIGPGLANELVKVLEFFGARGQLGQRR